MCCAHTCSIDLFNNQARPIYNIHILASPPIIISFTTQQKQTTTKILGSTVKKNALDYSTSSSRNKNKIYADAVASARTKFDHVDTFCETGAFEEYITLIAEECVSDVTTGLCVRADLFKREEGGAEITGASGIGGDPPCSNIRAASRWDEHRAMVRMFLVRHWEKFCKKQGGADGGQFCKKQAGADGG